MSRITVLGSGAWGTAIALSLCRRGGHHVTLWAHSAEAAQDILNARENTLFFPGFPIPSEIMITGRENAVANAEIIVSVVPSEFLRATISRLRPYLHDGQIIVSAVHVDVLRVAAGGWQLDREQRRGLGWLRMV